MKENKKFKSFRSELTESEYSEVIMGQPNTSAHTDFGTHRIDYPKVMANINAMLSVISKTSSVDPMEAFNKIRCRLNIVMLDFDFNIFRNWNQGVGSFVVPVTRFGRVDGYDAMTGQVRFDGKANNPDGFKELSMVVTVDLDADSLYVVSAKLYAADELQTTDAVDSVKEGTGYSDEEVKSGKQRSGRPYPEAKFPGWKVGKNMQTQKVKNGKKIGAARTIAAVSEDVEQVDELSKKTKDAYVAKRGSQLSSMMYGSGKNYNSLTGKKQANAVKGIKKAMGVKEDVEQVDEAGQAKLYRMRYSHGRAWRRGDKKKQDAMGVATYDKQKKEDAKDLNRTGSAFGMRVKRLAGNRKKMGYSESTIGEDIEQVDEAGQAKLYRMQYSHGRAWRRGDKKKQDAMGIARDNKQKKEDAKDLNRTGSAFEMRVKRLAGNRKAMGYSESTLIGKQKKLDANNNKRLDSQDFKLLRSKKSVKEELIGKQKKLDVNKNKRLDAEDFKALRAKRTMPDR